MRWWALVLGCTPATSPPSPSDGDADADADTDADADADTDADTGSIPTFPPFDTGPYGPAAGEGSVVVVWDADAGLARTRGVFVDDDLGHTDLAGCWPQPDRLCPIEAPVGWTPAPPFDPRGRTFLGVGPRLVVGPFSAERVADPLLGVRYAGSTPTSWPTGTVLGLTFAGGQWSPFVSAVGPALPPPIDLVRPTRNEIVRLYDGDDVVLRWEAAAGDHTLTLSVFGAEEPASNPLLHQRVLDDDGNHLLAVDDLGLAPANRDVRFLLQRTTRATLDVAGNPVTLSAVTEAAFDATHPPIADRLLAITTGTCVGSPTLTTGRYYGTFDFTQNDHSPGNAGCTSSATPGRDAAFTLNVPPGERVTLTGRRVRGDASLYLVTDCEDLTTCVAVADVAPSGRDEILVHTNPTETAQLLRLIVDSPTVDAALLHTLDVARDRPTVDPTGDSCAAAELLPAMGAGRYTVDLTGAVDHLDPTSGACALTPTDGPDVLLPLGVPAGETVSVTPMGPVALYLLEDCVDEGTCMAASARYQPLRWTNNGLVTARRTLVVDQPRQSPDIGPLDLLVEHTTLRTTVEAACPTASAPLTTGLHLLDVALTSADHDLPTPSCTFDAALGPDGVLPIRLAPGETLQVRYAHSGEGVVYLLDGCDPGATAVTCDDRIGLDEDLSWTNETDTPFDGVLVLDTWRPPGSVATAATATVELRIGP